MLSYILFTRWTPRDQENPGPGWISNSQTQEIARNPSYLRQQFGIEFDGPDEELQSIFSKYLQQFSIVVDAFSLDVSYIRKTTGPQLVITILHFPDKSVYSAFENADFWKQYRESRNSILDILNVKMEVKKYTSNTVGEWDLLLSKDANDLSLYFDSISDAEVSSYP